MTDVVILCGGIGTRLKDITGDKPKVLAEITDKPFLHFLIESIAKQGFKRFILCAGYKADDIEGYFQDKCPELNIVISTEDEQLGTAGALRLAAELIQSDNFIALNGDSFCRIDYNKLISGHNLSACDATVVAARMDEVNDYGLMEIDSKNRIISFKEKQKSGKGYVNAGIYCFKKDIFDKMPGNTPLSLEGDVFPLLAVSGINAFLTNQPFYDIGTPERFLKAREIFYADE